MCLLCHISLDGGWSGLKVLMAHTGAMAGGAGTGHQPHQGDVMLQTGGVTDRVCHHLPHINISCPGVSPWLLMSPSLTTPGDEGAATNQSDA